MKLKEIVVRLGYTLLGSLLTLCIVLIHEQYGSKEVETQATVEEIPIENVEMAGIPAVTVQTTTLDYEAEAKEKLAQLKAEAEAKKQEELSREAEEASNVEKGEIIEVRTVSANSIEAAPVKWKRDYPTLNSSKLLAEKELERSSYEETLAVNAFDKKVIEDSTIDFSDVKITIMGDSLSAGSNLSEEERTKYAYPVQLKEILGCKEVVNLGIGGSTISSLGADSMVERWNDVSKDSDIIIVFGGSNDMLFENKWEFGTLEYEKRMKSDTFCGDLDTLLSKMEWRYIENNDENYCKMICINPPSNILSDANYNTDPGNHIHQREFAAAINQIAQEYGFEVIDFYNNNILNTHDSNVQAQFMPDGIHGNAEGYRIIAEHIASQIIQRIEQ